MNQLKIAFLQVNLIWENRQANLEKIETLLAQVNNADVIILPEMFTTGFSMNAQKLADDREGETLDWLIRQSRQYNAAIAGSFIASQNGQFYNNLTWVQPDGQYYHYAKRHLFTFAGEDKIYSAGISRLMVNWQGWKICPLICYDLRFPIWSRNLSNFQPQHGSEAGGHYDVLIYVANWPQSRRFAWHSLLTARAIENQAYTIGVNRVGVDGKGLLYSGDSGIFNFDGTVLLDAASTEGVFTAILLYDKLADYRQKFGFLNDADAAILKL